MAKKTRGARAKHKVVRTKNPDWVKMPKEQIEEMVRKFHSEGLSSAMIGTRLKDQHGIPSVQLATGKSITQILKDGEVVFEVPEDLNSLLKRANNLKKHMKQNPKDKHNLRGLQLIEARIRRLAKHYAKKGKIPSGWKYSGATAEL